MQDFIFPIKLVSERANESFDPDRFKTIIQEYRQEHPSVQKSNKGGWQSQLFPPDEYISGSNFFSDMVRSAVETYKRGTRLGELGLDLELDTFWFNVNPPGTYNSLHIHPGSILSGVFWVSCPENCGRLVVRHPNEMVNYYLGPDELSIDPQEGLLVLFPSYLPHLVESNQGSEDRISISFNLNIKQ